MARKKSVSPFKTGRVEKRGGAGGSKFIGLKDGESVLFAPLVGLDFMTSADMHEYWDIKPAIYHPCIGRNCPGCEVGNESRFKAYLPVLVKGSDGEPSIFPFTVSVYNQLEDLEDAIGDDEGLKGTIVKVSRKGSGLSTRYTVLGTGKRLDVDGVEVPDFIPQLGPATAEDIWELLEKNGYYRDDTGDIVIGTGVEADEPAEDTSDDDDGWGDV